jgi:hypothetical protein
MFSSYYYMLLTYYPYISLYVAPNITMYFTPYIISIYVYMSIFLNTCIFIFIICIHMHMEEPHYICLPMKKTQLRKIMGKKCIQWSTNMCGVKAVMLISKIPYAFLCKPRQFLDVVGEPFSSKI